jgi:hypothetical protein
VHESYVAKLIEEGKDTKWFPINKSLTLIHSEEKGVRNSTLIS